LKLKCPTCGAVGTDVEPVAEEFRGPEWRPSKGEEDYAFEVFGRIGSRPVRKCLNCGAGVVVRFLPPRFRTIQPEMWAQMQKYMEKEMAGSAERREERRRQYEAERQRKAGDS